MSQAAPAKKTAIANAAAVGARLAALKAAAPAGTPWWRPALHFNWTEFRNGAEGTKWNTVSYIDEAGVRAPLQLRIFGERHSGQIMPRTDAGLSELAATVKNPKYPLKKRDKKACLQIQKWSTQVKTEEDQITIQVDPATGAPALPGDEYLSQYYRVASLVNEAFTAEANERVDRGVTLSTLVNKAKKANQREAQPILDALIAEHGPRSKADCIITPAIATAITQGFDADGARKLTADTLIVNMTKVTNLVQEYLSSNAPKNAGKPLPNPMTRINFAFPGATSKSNGTTFYDKDLPYVGANGKELYELGKVDGVPICDDNVHKFIPSRSLVDAVVRMDTICLSSMGISMPVNAELVIVKHPDRRDIDLSDLYDADDYSGYADGGSSSAAATVPAAATRVAAPVAAPSNPAAAAAAAVPDVDDDLLDQLSS